MTRKQPRLLPHFARTFVDCARHNPATLKYVAMMMGLYLYLHLGPFSRVVIGQIELQIAALDRGDWTAPTLAPPAEPMSARPAGRGGQRLTLGSMFAAADGAIPLRIENERARMTRIHWDVVFALGCAGLACGATAQQAAPLSADSPTTVYTGRGAGPARDEAAVARLLQRVRERGRIRVIVGLNMTMRDDDRLPPADEARQSQTLRQLQDAVAARVLGSASAADVNRYSIIPFLSMFVDADQLRRLLADLDVISIQEDVPVAPT
ncbi:MAG: hypothetical protein GEU91_07665 [Rhizobiales bacterium]|nr:hypothetical protein [Hyphomicrobiales bacterium]